MKNADANLASIICVVLVLPWLPSCSRERPEGVLRLHTSVPIELVEIIRLAFQEDFPNTTVDVVRSGTRSIVENILTKAAGGEPTGADAVWIADFAAAEELKNEKLLQKYVSPQARAIPPIFKDPEGYYIGTRLLSMVVVYNTKYVTKRPRSYQALLEHDYKGKTALPDPERSGSALYTMEVLLADPRFGWGFFYELQNQQSLSIAANNQVLIRRIAGGEYWIGIALDFSVRTQLRQMPSLPISYAYPEMGVVALPSPICITQDCANPKLAKAFVDWVLSRENQQFLSERLTITPVRPDVRVPEGMIGWDSLSIIPSDAGEIVKQREGSMQLLKDIFGGKNIEELNIEVWN